MKPSIGRIVRYKLTGADACDINRRRHDFTAFTRAHPRPGEPGLHGASGHTGHYGNHAAEGDVLPAMIVRTWQQESVNLQVFLDGNDVFWTADRREGEEPGQWSWPERVPPGMTFREVSPQDMTHAAINLK